MKFIKTSGLCYYSPATEKKGDKFIIDNYPKLLEQGKRQWCTTESKKFTTLEKFNILLTELNKLNNFNNNLISEYK